MFQHIDFLKSKNNSVYNRLIFENINGILDKLHSVGLNDTDLYFFNNTSELFLKHIFYSFNPLEASNEFEDYYFEDIEFVLLWDFKNISFDIQKLNSDDCDFHSHFTEFKESFTNNSYDHYLSESIDYSTSKNNIFSFKFFYGGIFYLVSLNIDFSKSSFLLDEYGDLSLKNQNDPILNEINTNNLNLFDSFSKKHVINQFHSIFDFSFNKKEKEIFIEFLNDFVYLFDSEMFSHTDFLSNVENKTLIFDSVSPLKLEIKESTSKNPISVDDIFDNDDLYDIFLDNFSLEINNHSFGTDISRFTFSLNISINNKSYYVSLSSDTICFEINLSSPNNEFAN